MDKFTLIMIICAFLAAIVFLVIHGHFIFGGLLLLAFVSFQYRSSE